jgi:ankyrin repeat protein
VTDSSGRTALHLAASCGHGAVVRWLVRRAHAGIDVRDIESGYTALHRSIFYGQIHVAADLIKVGNINKILIMGLRADHFQEMYILTRMTFLYLQRLLVFVEVFVSLEGKNISFSGQEEEMESKSIMKGIG